MSPPRSQSLAELAREMLTFVEKIPVSANLEWTKDLEFLTDFEADRVLIMRQALLDAGLTEESEFNVLDFGYLHGVVPEFIHRAFPHCRFTTCDWPGCPIFQNAEYLEVIASRRYLKLLPLDINQVDELEERFDVIILGEIIEHLDPTVVASALGKLRQRVQEDGLLLITTPNGGGMYNAMSAMSNHDVTHPPIPDAMMGYGHIHLWTVSVLRQTLNYTGWADRQIYYTHGRETALFRQARNVRPSFKYLVFIKAVEFLAEFRPALRGFFVLAAKPLRRAGAHDRAS